MAISCDTRSDVTTARAGELEPAGQPAAAPESLVPRESTIDPQLVTADPAAARDLPLRRGQYRITGKMAMKPGFKPVFLQNITRAIRAGDNEAKRVHFYKIEFLPTGEIIDGAQVARFTVVAHIIDNPVWLVPLLWGAAGIGTALGGWMLVDKVESFTETGTGKVLSIAAAMVTILLGIRFFRGSK